MTGTVQLESDVEEGIQRLARALQAFVRRAAVEIGIRARPELDALYRQHLVESIEKRTTRRTGMLANAPVVRSFAVRAGRRVILRARFPATAYNTPSGRGRPDSSKVGQWAFVVNHNRRFIQLANNRMRRDPRVRQIFQVHAAAALADALRSQGDREGQ